MVIQKRNLNLWKKFRIYYTRLFAGYGRFEPRDDVQFSDWDKIDWENIHENYGIKRAEKVLKYIPQTDGLHLDIGTGRGDGTYLISKRKRCIGIDYGTKSALIAKEKVENIIVCDSRHLPFKDNTFDSVTCLDVIEHIPKAGVAIQEISRVLDRKGMLILTTPTAEMPVEKLVKKLKKYKLIKENQPYNSPYLLKELKLFFKNSNFIIKKICLINDWMPNPVFRLFLYSRLFVLQNKK